MGLTSEDPSVVRTEEKHLGIMSIQTAFRAMRLGEITKGVQCRQCKDWASERFNMGFGGKELAVEIEGE